jgi:hypothetical protein
MEVRLMDVVLVSATLSATSSVLAVMHWFPWHGGARALRRTTAYAMGTSVVVGVPALAMVLVAAMGFAYREVFWAALLVVNALVAGVTVNVAYWIDGKRAVGHREVAQEVRRHAEGWE